MARRQPTTLVKNSFLWADKTNRSLLTSLNNFNEKYHDNYGEFSNPDIWKKYLGDIFNGDLYKDDSFENNEESRRALDIYFEIILKMTRNFKNPRINEDFQNLRDGYSDKAAKQSEKIQKFGDKYEYLAQKFKNLSIAMGNRSFEIQTNIVIDTNPIADNFSYTPGNYKLGIQTINPNCQPLFLNQCLLIGKKLNTGSLLISPETMIKTYIKGVKYFKKSENMGDANFEEIYTKFPTQMTAFLKYLFDNTLQNPTYEFQNVNKNELNWYLNFRSFVNENRESLRTIIKENCSYPLEKQDGKFQFQIPKYEYEESKTETLPHNFITFGIKNTKKLSDILNFRVETTGKWAVQNYGKDEFDEIVDSKIGDFKLYFWQKNAIKFSKEGKSFVIWGDTSGGKTHVLMLIMMETAITLTQNFIYCAPTDQLALQTFANVYCTLNGSSKIDEVALIIEQITYVPRRAKIFIGTPKELSDFFARYNRGSSFGETYLTKHMDSIYKIAVDECHTMANEYNPTEEGMKSAKSIYNLITGLQGNGERVQFIGMSASLSQQSFNALEEQIKIASGINEIDLIKYTRGTAKMYEQPEEEIIIESNQTEYNVSYDDGFIGENGEHREIQLDNAFYQSLVFKIIEDKRTPSALFFKHEIDAIQAMRNFVEYLDDKQNKSQWQNMKNDKTANHWGESEIKILLENNIRSLMATSSKETVKCSPNYFEDLLSFYLRNINVANRPQGDIVYSIDLYAMLYEFKNLYEKKSTFVSDVHPFFDFANIGIDRRNNFDISTLQNFLRCESLNVDNELIKSLIKGLKYGIGLITSSIPLSFQLEISKILMRMKESKNGEFGIRFVFCDYSLSMGVDYPLTSAAIINSKLEDISLGEKKQKCGRAGRNDTNGNYLPSTVYFVNVANYQNLKNQVDNLTFNMANIEGSYYNPRNIETALRKLLTSHISDILTPLFMKDEIFPKITQIPETNLNLRYKHVKRCLRELYDVSKVLIPSQAEKILNIYKDVQIKIYQMMIS